MKTERPFPPRSHPGFGKDSIGFFPSIMACLLFNAECYGKAKENILHRPWFQRFRKLRSQNSEREGNWSVCKSKIAIRPIYVNGSDFPIKTRLRLFFFLCPEILFLTEQRNSQRVAYKSRAYNCNHVLMSSLFKRKSMMNPSYREGLFCNMQNHL